MSDDSKNETYSEEETVARREAVLKRMLETPKEARKNKAPKAATGKAHRKEG